MNMSSFTVARLQVWVRPLEKVEMVPEVPVQPEMAVQGVQEVLEMPLKEV